MVSSPSQDTEEWDAENNLPIAIQLQSFSEKVFEISKEDFISCFNRPKKQSKL